MGKNLISAVEEIDADKKLQDAVVGWEPFDHTLQSPNPFYTSCGSHKTSWNPNSKSQLLNNPRIKSNLTTEFYITNKYIYKLTYTLKVNATISPTDDYRNLRAFDIKTTIIDRQTKQVADVVLSKTLADAREHISFLTTIEEEAKWKQKTK